MAQVTAQAARDRIAGCDAASVRNGVFTVRRSFYYLDPNDQAGFESAVRRAFPNVNILESGTLYKAFVGGAPIGKQSHYWVKFIL